MVLLLLLDRARSQRSWIGNRFFITFAFASSRACLRYELCWRAKRLYCSTRLGLGPSWGWKHCGNPVCSRHGCRGKEHFEQATTYLRSSGLLPRKMVMLISRVQGCRMPAVSLCPICRTSGLSHEKVALWVLELCIYEWSSSYFARFAVKSITTLAGIRWVTWLCLLNSFFLQKT